LTDNRKGITKKVLIDAKETAGWEIFPLPMEDLSKIHFSPADVSDLPAFHREFFDLNKTGDAFLDMSGWGKGCVWVNGHNLGRFWNIGPQQSLYCPGIWLKTGNNELIVFELEDKGKRSVEGIDKPILNELGTDALAPPMPVRTGGLLKLSPGDMAATGTFVAGDSEQVVTIKPVRARYVCLQSLSSLRDDPFASTAEFNVLGANGEKADRSRWKIYSIDSEELKAEDGRAENAIDGDVESIWHTQWGAAKPPHPHYIAIDLGQVQTVGGFVYQSRQGNAPGKIKEYRFYARTEAFERE
jgi:beta-galactosidase